MMIFPKKFEVLEFENDNKKIINKENDESYKVKYNIRKLNKDNEESDNEKDIDVLGGITRKSFNESSILRRSLKKYEKKPIDDNIEDNKNKKIIVTSSFNKEISNNDNENNFPKLKSVNYYNNKLKDNYEEVEESEDGEDYLVVKETITRTDIRTKINKKIKKKKRGLIELREDNIRSNDAEF